MYLDRRAFIRQRSGRHCSAAGARRASLGKAGRYAVIMPHSTRRRLARALAMLRHKHVEVPKRKHDNLPL